MKVLVILAICCFQTAISINSVVNGVIGEGLVWNFPLVEMKEEYNKRIPTNKINFKDLQRYIIVTFTKRNSAEEVTVFMDGKSMNQWDGSQTEIFIDYDNFISIKREIIINDVGIYKIYCKIHSRTIYFGQICLSVTGRPQITGGKTPNPWHNLTMLECHSVPTRIGDCQLASSMYTIWYQNGERMKELGPYSYKINVTLDQNGDNFTCLVVDSNSCYDKLQTTNHYNEVSDEEECEGVFENNTFLFPPEHKTVPEVSEDVNVWVIIMPVTVFIAVAVIVVILIIIWIKICRRKNDSNNHQNIEEEMKPMKN